MVKRSSFVALLLLASACGADADAPPPQTGVAENCSTPVGACALQTCAPDRLEARHVTACSQIVWPTNPPTSGQHYPIWAAFKDYGKPVPRGFWLHSAEHSAIVLAYNCAHAVGACTDLVAKLTSFAAGYAADPLCDTTVGNRIIVTPDPLLDVAFAAVAWGHSLKGSCFESAPVKAFADLHYGKNYENFCSDGVDPTDPASGFAADCGL